jgi:hypothetical protein
VAKQIDAYVTGLNEVLRAFKALPKEAGVELRLASLDIADRIMVPAWRNAAINYAGPWGPKIADSIRAKKDRIPSVNIGYAKKVYSGGASSINTRFPANAGTTGRAGPTAAPFGQGTDWIRNVQPYQAQALNEWAKAVDVIVRKWDTTP